MALPIIRTAFPLIVASIAFAQPPAPQTTPKGDSLAPGHGTALQAAQKKVKQPGTATAKKLKPQSTCPVLGGPIDKKLYVDYHGKRIYVCCAGCIEEVRKSPAQYIEKLEKAGQSVEIIDTGKAKRAAPAPDKADGAAGGGMGSMKM